MGLQRVRHEWTTFTSLHFASLLISCDQHIREHSVKKQLHRSPSCCRRHKWPMACFVHSPYYSLIITPRPSFLQVVASRWLGTAGHQSTRQTPPMGNFGSGLPWTWPNCSSCSWGSCSPVFFPSLSHPRVADLHCDLNFSLPSPAPSPNTSFAHWPFSRPKVTQGPEVLIE